MPRRPITALLCACAAAGVSSGCLQRTVAAEGQYGRQIPLTDQDDLELPRLAFRSEACPGEAGGCAAWCEDRPQDCLDQDADACMPMLIDSGSPFTILPGADGKFAIERRCFEVRAAQGLGVGASASALSAAVARFRFVDPPIVQAPADDVAGWAWEIGSDRASARVGAVLGGNTLRHFAVALRAVPGGERTVAFFRSFPGDEPALADQGRAYVRLQYPSRLLGRGVNDRCEVGGIDCELEGIDVRPDQEDLVYDSTRMLVDACLAPPPCASLFESDPADPGAQPSCHLRPGGDFGRETCTSATAEVGGGESATLLVATGMPDVALFEDSATRMFGPIGDLPACGDPLLATEDGLDVRACRTGEVGVLHVTGWPSLTNLVRLRIRALALLPGNTSATGVDPCRRLERRLLGLHAQCIDYAALAQPREPLLRGDFEDARVDHAAFAVGETQWAGAQAAPDTTRWLDVVVVPSTSPIVLALRRDVGGFALEPDGMVGSAILRSTETVLDYTEEEEDPGLRITCLSPGAGDCLSIPSCHPVDPGETSDKDNGDGPDGRAGRVSCCFGLPQSLIARVIREGAQKAPPRVEEACCGALSPDALAQLQAEEAGLCAGVDPL